MKVLVVAGYCLRVNSSANLCHLSYIKGLIDAGHDVELLTVSEKGQCVDESICLPQNIKKYSYDGSLYERMSNKKRGTINKIVYSEQNISNKTQQSENKMITVKKMIRNIYGVHGTDIVWYMHALRFKSSNMYDVVISLAHPPVSHKLVKVLSDKKRLKFKRWVQIWEDPWALDLWGGVDNPSIRKEEGRILSYADVICYVSPLTLLYQKKMFPNVSQKMIWQPVPSYYKTEEQAHHCKDNIYGYFGDYIPSVRNLKPFYDAAIAKRIKVNICGNPIGLFCSNGNVLIHPRMSLDDLNKFESITNVLVFLCNLKGGQIPGKIYQYSATNKIILFILDGTEEEKKVIKEYFGKYNRYIFCNNTVEEIENAILHIENDDFENIMSRPIDDFAPTNIINNIFVLSGIAE